MTTIPEFYEHIRTAEEHLTRAVQLLDAATPPRKPIDVVVKNRALESIDSAVAVLNAALNDERMGHLYLEQEANDHDRERAEFGDDLPF